MQIGLEKKHICNSFKTQFFSLSGLMNAFKSGPSSQPVQKRPIGTKNGDFVGFISWKTRLRRYLIQA